MVHNLKLETGPFLILYGIVAAVVLAACNRVEQNKLAEIDGQAVYASDLEKKAGKELSVQRKILYRLEKKKLEEFIGAMLLTREAKKPRYCGGDAPGTGA